MIITILADNRTLNSQCFATEHGLSVHIQSAEHSLLLDTGASSLFATNAQAMGLDLSAVDIVFISHGHQDHAGGLATFLDLNKRAQVIVSSAAVGGRYFSKRSFLHSITTEWPREAMKGRTIYVDDTQDLGDDIRAVANISQNNPMPKGNNNLFVESSAGTLLPDDFRHELVLYVNGLLFTGCAHNGLENILASCPWPIHTVLGGFHLLDAHAGENYESIEELTALAHRLKDHYPTTTFYTSHCTGDQVFSTMHTVMGDRLKPFCCGMQLNIEESPLQP